jgi:glyoxylase-like metal-dependent hydrolase (beta-lactamase superfamily II)
MVRAPTGTILWDCIGFLDDTTVTLIKALGGLTAIACSHPHFLGSVVEWSHAFDNIPVYLHAMDRKFVTRSDPVITFWEGDHLELAEGLTSIRCGGHFPGSSVLHWAQGADGNGVLLTGDTVQVRPDKGLTFMHSYPNQIPLDAGRVLHIAEILKPWPFEAIYGGWWDRVIPANAKAILAASVEQYVDAVTGSLEIF